MWRRGKILTGILAIVTLLFITTLPVMALQNAIRQDVGAKCNIRASKASINWTNPNINTNNGGTYNRVGVTRQIVANNRPATQFAEVGWLKQVSLNIFGIPVTTEWIYISYTDVNGQLKHDYMSRPQRSVHQFTVQYDPVNTKEWYFFENGQVVNSKGYPTDFAKGCAAFAGGEVYTNVENMGNTRFYNLQRGKINGQGIATGGAWLTNTVRIQQSPYMCLPIGIIEHTCSP